MGTDLLDSFYVDNVQVLCIQMKTQSNAWWEEVEMMNTQVLQGQKSNFKGSWDGTIGRRRKEERYKAYSLCSVSLCIP